MIWEHKSSPTDMKLKAKSIEFDLRITATQRSELHDADSRTNSGTINDS